MFFGSLIFPRIRGQAGRKDGDLRIEIGTEPSRRLGSGSLQPLALGATQLSRPSELESRQKPECDEKCRHEKK